VHNAYEKKTTNVQEFEMSKLGALSYFLGMEFVNDKRRSASASKKICKRCTEEVQ